MNHAKKNRRFLLFAAGVLISLLATAGSEAADVVQYTTPLGRGSAKIDDQGRLIISKKRIFENVVHPSNFPLACSSLVITDGDNWAGIRMVHLDGFVFIKGILKENRT